MRISNKEINNLSKIFVLFFSSLFLILLVSLAVFHSFASANIEGRETSTDWLTAKIRAEAIVLLGITETVADYLAQEGNNDRKVEYGLLSEWLRTTRDAVSLYETAKSDRIVFNTLRDIYTKLANSALLAFANMSEEEEDTYAEQILYEGLLAYEKSKEFWEQNSLSLLPQRASLISKVLAASTSSLNKPVLDVNSIFSYIEKTINSQKNPETYLPAIYSYLDSIFNYTFFESTGGAGVQALRSLKEKVLNLKEETARKGILAYLDQKIISAQRLTAKPQSATTVSKSRATAQVVSSQQKNKQPAPKTTPKPQAPQVNTSQTSTPSAEITVSKPEAATTAPPKPSGQIAEEKMRWVYRYKANADNISYALIWKNPPQDKKPLIEGSLNNDLKASDLKELSFKDDNDPLTKATIIPVGWRDEPGQRFAYPSEKQKETTPWQEKVSEVSSRFELVEAVNLEREVGDFYGLIKVIDSDSSPEKKKKNDALTIIGTVLRAGISIFSNGRIGTPGRDIQNKIEENIPPEILDFIGNVSSNVNKNKTAQNTDRLTNEEINKIVSELKEFLIFQRAMDIQDLGFSEKDTGISFAGKLSMEDGQMYLRLFVPKLSIERLREHLENDKLLFNRPDTSDKLKKILQTSIQSQEAVIKNFEEGKYGVADGVNVVERSLVLPSQPIPLTFVENRPPRTVYGEFQPGEYVWKAENIDVSFKTKMKKGRNTVEEVTIRGNLSINVFVEKPMNPTQGLETVPIVTVNFSPILDENAKALYEQMKSSISVASRQFTVNKPWQHSALKEYALSLFEKRR